jgi:hypothetical protein
MQTQDICCRRKTNIILGVQLASARRLDYSRWQLFEPVLQVIELTYSSLPINHTFFAIYQSPGASTARPGTFMRAMLPRRNSAITISGIWNEL